MCGDRVLFISEDDLWEVPLTGGVAQRLTNGAGAITRVSLSPNGQRVALTSSEEGVEEVYVMDADGGPMQRLTFLGEPSRVVGWTPDGEGIVFASSWRRPFPRATGLYVVPCGGGEPRALEVGEGVGVCFEPGGKGRVVNRYDNDASWWKRYRGGLAGQLWIDRAGDERWVRLSACDPAPMMCPMWLGDRIWFVSDVEGHGNLYSCALDGSDRRRHTDHLGAYVRAPQTDGRTIVYQRGADLWRLDALDPDAEAERLEIKLRSQRVQLRRKFVDGDAYIEEFALHPGGHALAAVVRGKPLSFGLWEGAVRQTGEEQGVRYRLPCYSADGARLLVVSDAGGEEALEWHAADGASAPERLEVQGVELGRPIAMTISPRGEHVAIANHRHELLLITLADGQGQVIARSGYERVEGFSWSPDSRWIAYAEQTSMLTSRIMLWSLEQGEAFEVTPGEFMDTSPCFDPRGRYLYFLSTRAFDPVYGSTFFELSFPKGRKPCLVTLQSDLESPFIERPRPLGEDEPPEDAPEEIVAEDAEVSDDAEPGDDASEVFEEGEASEADEGDEGEGDEGEGDEGEDDEGDEQAEGDAPEEDPAMPIDLDGIADRVLTFPVGEARYTDIGATEERVFWLVEAVRGARGESSDGGRLIYYDLKKRKRKGFMDQVHSFLIGDDRKTLAAWTEDGLRVVEAEGDRPEESPEEPSRETGLIDLERLRVEIDPMAEWRQMLREIWRLMRDHFWRADMGGVDWSAVWDRYAAELERVGTRGEFSDLVWRMQGELGTSHAYEYGGDYREGPDYEVGFLGVDVLWDRAYENPLTGEAGAYRVDHIVQGDLWDRRTASPLAAPGVNVREGDALLAINGRVLTRERSIQQRLVNAGGLEIELVVHTPGDEAPRTITTHTLRSERAARYREWVHQRRALVHAQTEGRVGYLHVPDMGADGYAEFHRGLMAESHREGLIVDVRHNGGGHVSQLLIERLSRRRLGYDVSRWMEPFAYPMDSPGEVIVALTNAYAGSDGDIFSHVFKARALGPLLGTRTWGGVVGIWPRHQLVDGSVTTQPEFASWLDGVGYALENHGTDPDEVVELSPGDDARGDDPQLDAAIARALSMLPDSPQPPRFDPPPAPEPPPTSLPDRKRAE